MFTPLPKRMLSEHLVPFLIRRRTVFPAQDVTNLLLALFRYATNWSVRTRGDLGTLVQLWQANRAYEGEPPEYFLCIKVRAKRADVAPILAATAARGLVMREEPSADPWQYNGFLEVPLGNGAPQRVREVTDVLQPILVACIQALFSTDTPFVVQHQDSRYVRFDVAGAPELPPFRNLLDLALATRVSQVRAFLRNNICVEALCGVDMVLEEPAEGVDSENDDDDWYKLFEQEFAVMPDGSGMLRVTFREKPSAAEQAQFAALLQPFTDHVTVVPTTARSCDIFGPPVAVRSIAPALLQVFPEPSNRIQFDHTVRLSFNGVTSDVRVQPTALVQDSPIFARAAEQLGFRHPDEMALKLGLAPTTVLPPARAFKVGAVVHLDEAD